MAGNELIEFCGELKHETEKAYLVYDGEDEIWLPKSQCQGISQESGGDVWEFLIPEWLAEEKGII